MKSISATLIESNKTLVKRVDRKKGFSIIDMHFNLISIATIKSRNTRSKSENGCLEANSIFPQLIACSLFLFEYPFAKQVILIHNYFTNQEH